MRAEEQQRFGEFAAGPILQSAVGALDLAAQHLAELVHYGWHPVIPRFQEDDAEALVWRRHDERHRPAQERLAQLV